MSLLETRGLVIRKSGRVLIDDVSIGFGPGEFVGVIGANGAGKSTFLTALAGLSRPDAGSVLLDGKPLSLVGAKALSRRRAYLPQNPRAEWPISVERLVALGLMPQLPAIGGLPAEFAPKLEAVLTDCDLLAHRDQPATTLSGGELARAMLARALVGQPDILIADEPLTGLDPRHALDSVARLGDLARQDKLVVASIHDLTLAARYTTRILAIHKGRVAADGPTSQVLTPDLLRHLFEVEACVSGAGTGAHVDFVATMPARAGV